RQARDDECDAVGRMEFAQGDDQESGDYPALGSARIEHQSVAMAMDDPCFIPVMISAFMEVAGIFVLLHSLNNRQWEAKCQKCNYDLRAHGDNGICPECGAAFQPGMARRFRGHPLRIWTLVLGIALMTAPVAYWLWLLVVLTWIDPIRC